MAVSPDTPLTLPQVAEAAEVEYRTLHTWVKRGLLEPSFNVSTGAGRPNLFTFQDALKARILGHLRSAGIDLEMLERTADGLKHAPELGNEHTLLLNGRLHFLEGDIDLDKEIKEKQPSLIYRVSWAEEALSRVSLN